MRMRTTNTYDDDDDDSSEHYWVQSTFNPESPVTNTGSLNMVVQQRYAINECVANTIL